MNLYPLRAHISVAVLAMGLLVYSQAYGLETDSQQEQSTPVYTPPDRGAPLSRVGGGSRGGEDAAQSVRVLTPEHLGASASPEPMLYWFLQGQTHAAIELTLIDERSVAPLLDIRLPGPTAAGLHTIDLRQQGVRLEPNVPYQWSVAVVVDPEQRSLDILASGAVIYRPAPREIQEAIATIGTSERAVKYAAAGYWYDALHTLLSSASTGNDAAQIRAAAVSLLEQVGLTGDALP